MQYQAENTTWLCSELVTVRYENGTEVREAFGNLEEISCASAVLLTDSALGNQRVSLLVQGHELSGRVSAAVYDPVLGWFTTIELDRDWSPEWFRPAHLLRLDSVTLTAASAA